MSSDDGEEDGDDEEDSPYEGRCDVHNAAPGSFLSAALRSPGKKATNESTEFVLKRRFLFHNFLMIQPSFTYHVPSKRTHVVRSFSHLGGTGLCGSWRSTAQPAPVGPCWVPVGPKWARSLKGYDLI